MSQSPIVDMVAVKAALKGKRVRLTDDEVLWAVHHGIGQRMTLNAVARVLHTSLRRARLLAAQPLPVGCDVTDVDDWSLPQDCEVAA